MIAIDFDPTVCYYSQLVELAKKFRLKISREFTPSSQPQKLYEEYIRLLSIVSLDSSVDIDTDSIDTPDIFDVSDLMYSIFINLSFLLV